MFADGEWHTAQEAMAVGAHLVRPERAMRRFLSRGSLSANKKKIPDDLRIIQGQEEIARNEVNYLAFQKKLEKRDGNYCKEYRLKDV